MHPSHALSRQLLFIDPDNLGDSSVQPVAAAQGYSVRREADFATALSAAKSGAVCPVILIGGLTGRIAAEDQAILDLVGALRRTTSHSQLILLIPPTVDLELCCRAIECGVSDFLEVSGGGIDPDSLQRRLLHAGERYERKRSDTESLHAQLSAAEYGIVTQSPQMAGVLARAGRAAEISEAPVLIYGESGTGKQLIAELIHRLDPKRSQHPLLTVNCAAIAGPLAESALFGHVKGAFTGATQERDGYFRAANHGTILLDEISELDSHLQPKLLRVLQEGLIMPVGADAEQPVDVRVLAASNRRLSELVQSGEFRLDLYQRLNVICVEIPPLRDRPEDIASLVPFFVEKYSRYYKSKIVGIDRRVMEFLARCDFGGNVRELENTIRRILAFKTTGNEIVLSDIPESLWQERSLRQPEDVVPRDLVDFACRAIECGRITLPDFIAECERHVLAGAIERSNAPGEDLARQLGMSRRTLYNKRRKYDL